ncbi:YchJ family protein [Carboxylicivirga sp. RSCT41]|uniref:YchJ family protein n=1 Tax=Carboxylicivirga agarovorans TaxID=3417570 RepID=UPI003D33DCD3
MKCPCSSGNNYNCCCQPYLENKQDAPTALQLMRSRYTAFTQGNINYLIKTHHISTRPLKEKEDIEQWARSVQWMGLTIINSEKGQATDTEGMVEFKALFIENGQLQAIHEKSLFRKEKGMWFYTSGQQY